MFEFAILVTAAFPLAWFFSEFQSRQWLRILLGCCAITMSFGVAWLAGSLQALNYNAWYGTSSQQLIEKTLQELKAGNEAKVIDNLQWFKASYSPSYETGRVDYERLVTAYLERFETLGK